MQNETYFLNNFQMNFFWDLRRFWEILKLEMESKEEENEKVF